MTVQRQMLKARRLPKEQSILHHRHQKQLKTKFPPKVQTQQTRLLR